MEPINLQYLPNTDSFTFWGEVFSHCIPQTQDVCALVSCQDLPSPLEGEGLTGGLTRDVSLGTWDESFLKPFLKLCS